MYQPSSIETKREKDEEEKAEERNDGPSEAETARLQLFRQEERIRRLLSILRREKALLPERSFSDPSAEERERGR